MLVLLTSTEAVRERSLIILIRHTYAQHLSIIYLALRCFERRDKPGPLLSHGWGNFGHPRGL